LPDATEGATRSDRPALPVGRALREKPAFKDQPARNGDKLSREARSAALARLAGWQEVSGRDAIAKTFVFADFNEAYPRRPRRGKDGPPSGVVVRRAAEVRDLAGTRSSSMPRSCACCG
jgi:hypothetical protein